MVSVPAPREIVVSGRLARLPELVEALACSLATSPRCSPLVPGRASAAAHGGALLADALAGGRDAALAERCGCASPAAPRLTICASPAPRRSRWGDIAAL